MTEPGSVKPDSPVTIVIADDHPLYRDGVARILDRHVDLVLLGEAADGEAALEQIQAHNPDVALVDLKLPGRDGIEVIEVLSRTQSATDVIIVSAYDDSATVHRALAAGARAYLLKVVSGEVLCDTIRAVAAGETVIPSNLQSRLVEEMRRQQKAGDYVLTAREVEILGLAAQGLSTNRIAEELFVGVTTVKTHLQHIYRKLEASDRAAAVAAALRRGILT